MWGSLSWNSANFIWSSLAHNTTFRYATCTLIIFYLVYFNLIEAFAHITAQISD